MKIVYIASGIPLPGSLGGSTHTLEVARGLAARGHELHVVACQQEGHLALADLIRPRSTRYEGFFLHHIDVPKSMALLCLPVISRLVQALAPNALMERYYNFAGCGLLAAQKLKIPSLLEVNALIVDPPEIRKRRIDDRLGRPMQGWALAQCRMATRIVTPLHTTVPAEIPRSKIIELPWGAAVERFSAVSAQRLGVHQRVRPSDDQTGIWGGREAGFCQTGDQDSEGGDHGQGSGELGRPDEQEALAATQYFVSSHTQAIPKVMFLGSFRAWHGILDFMRAAELLLASGRDLHFMLIGDGPLRREAERFASRWPTYFTFTGAVPYEQVPKLLSTATLGVAPFNTAPHPALRAAGFFWSPLKIYEYMAAGLPVVTANIAPLNTVIREGSEGILFREGDSADMAAAIARLLDDPQAAQAMGQRARERVVAHYSWSQHCAELEAILMSI